MARSKKACIIFFDEVDAIGGTRFDDGVGGDNEVQRTMLEIVNQLDGFDARGNIKVLMATNRLVKLVTYLSGPFFCLMLLQHLWHLNNLVFHFRNRNGVLYTSLCCGFRLPLFSGLTHLIPHCYVLDD